MVSVLLNRRQGLLHQFIQSCIFAQSLGSSAQFIALAARPNHQQVIWVELGRRAPILGRIHGLTMRTKSQAIIARFVIARKRLVECVEARTQQLLLVLLQTILALQILLFTNEGVARITVAASRDRLSGLHAVDGLEHLLVVEAAGIHILEMILWLLKSFFLPVPVVND